MKPFNYRKIMKNQMKNQILILTLHTLSSHSAFSSALAEKTESFEISTLSQSKSLPTLPAKKNLVSIDDSLIGQNWEIIPNDESDECLSSDLEIFQEAEMKAFNEASFQVQKNGWFVYNPSANKFEQKPIKLSKAQKNTINIINKKKSKENPDFQRLTYPDIKTLVEGKKIAIIAHGCDSCKQDMADLAKIIDDNSNIYDYFIFFEYNSKQGIEAIATAYSKGLYDLIKTKNGTKITLFTHSMGGLVNRSALRMPVDKVLGFPISLMEKIVDRQKHLALVTFGTPHGGVPSLYKSEGLLHNIGRLSNYPNSGLLYYLHSSVRDMMTSDTLNTPTSQSDFLAKLNDGKSWKYSKNLHLFTVAGNTAISYPGYSIFKLLNYTTYDDNQYDGLVTINSAFHSQLNFESDSWKKDLTRRIIIPANHYNMKASKGKSSEIDSSRVETYHIIDKNGTIILDQELIKTHTQKDLKVLYNAFKISGNEEQIKFIEKTIKNQYTLSSYFRGVRRISDDILEKYKNFVKLDYKVEITREKDIEQIVTQVMKSWLPEIEKTLSYKTSSEPTKQLVHKKTEIKKNQPTPQETKSKGIWNKAKSIFVK